MTPHLTTPRFFQPLRQSPQPARAADPVELRVPHKAPPGVWHPPTGLAEPRLSWLLSRLIAWSVASVLLAIVVDVSVRHFWPTPDYWLDVLILAGVTLPLLIVGGVHFVRRAAAQERTLREQERQTLQQARRDPLTGADNRQALTEAVAELNRQRPGLMAALFVLDLHEFQRINDACGHEVGDEVLREVARRLRTLLFAYGKWALPQEPKAGSLLSARLVRVGSDELALWLPDWSATAAASRVAEDLLAALDGPFQVGELTLHMRGSVGYVVDRLGGLTGNEWLTRANAATQQAKRIGVGQHAAFADEQIQAMVRRHGLHQALQASLHGDTGFWLQFQPIVSIDRRRLVGCEALLRWRHPHGGEVSPAEFIPVAEGSGLIRPLGRWVLARAVAQLAQWRRRPDLAVAPGFKISVNVSRAQLHAPDLVAYLESLLHAHEVPAGQLRLEVTESLPLDDLDSLITLERLRGLGVSLALDDFGTGYSSLSALLNLPIRSVKIDRHFVEGIDRCPNRQALVAGVVRVAQVMRLEVVAEGIEQAAEAHTLRELGCHHMQGWFVSRALDAEAFASQWLVPAAAEAPTPCTAATAVPLAATVCDGQACQLPRFHACPQPLGTH